MLLNFVVFVLAVSQTGWAQRGCSRDRMRQCQDELNRSIQRRVNDMGSDLFSHCRNLKEDFNCLLRETRCLTSESERSRNGDSLRNALTYIRNYCDSQGASWRDSGCFVGSDMKNCESSYPLGGSQYASHNPETCRKFNLFQDCVLEIVKNRCRQDDEKHLGQYLVDSAQDLAWNCGESSSMSDWDRNRDDTRDRDRGHDRDRNYGDRGSYSDRDRDRERDYRNRDSDRNGGYRDRNGDRDRYSDRYSGGSSYGNGSNSGITCCRNERCDRSRQQQCRDSLARTIDNRISGYQDSQKCRKIRDDFNCLLWQTSSCMPREERDRDNDVFRRAKDYISRNCDSYGRWSENSCYKSTEMQRCENLLSSTSRGASFESCRSYLSFKDCMTDELARRCTREDELYQGAYIVDKAQEMSWQCGSDNQNGRDQYNTYDRRDQYDLGHNGNGGYNGGYDSPQHLEDEDAACLSRVQGLADQCKGHLDEKRREMYIENDYNVRNKISCCSARQYRTCLYDATRRMCQSERVRVVDSLMGRYRYDLNGDKCRGVFDDECSGSTHTQISYMLLVACLVVLSTLFTLHL